MPKKRLSVIAQEYNISYKQAQELVFQNLDENMVSGLPHLLWIDDKGQDALDDLIPMPVLYRGKVLKECPNPSYVSVHHRERSAKVNVKIPRRMRGKLVGKMIYFREKNDGESRTYDWVKG